MRAARRGPWIVASIALVVTTVAGCSRGSDTAPTTTTGSGAVVDGGTLRMALGEPVQPDPAMASLGSPEALLVLDLLYDGLTRVDDDGVPQPALAASWKASKDLRTWEFHLDPAAEFSDGTPVKAAAVVASLEHLAEPGDASLAALRLELVTGFRAFVDGTAPHLAGLTAPDARTVKVALDAPQSALPVILGSPAFGIVDVPSLARAVKAKDLSELALSGGWEVRSARSSTVTVARRAGAPGHLEAVALRSYRDSDAAYAAYDAGDADWALVPADEYEDATKAHGAAAVTPFHAELFFGLRVGAPGLDQPELRQAIAAAIDRDAIVARVYPDLADPLATIVPAGVPGHDPDRCGTCGHDLARAKRLVAAAYPDGKVPTIPIDFDKSAAQAEMAAMVAADLKAAGIPTTLRPKTLADYKRFVVTGGQALFSFGWIGGYRSADAYLAPLFASAANDNLTGYARTAVDAALASARATTSAATSARHWANVERQVLEDAVVVPIAQFRIQAVVAPRVRGYAPDVDGSLDWSAVSVTDGA